MANKSVSFFRSFRFKMAVVVVSIQLLLIVISGIFLLNQTRTEAINKAYTANSQTINTVGDIVSNSFEDFSRNLNLLAISSKDLSSFERDSASSFLKSYKVSQLLFSGEVATLYGPEKNAIANTTMTSSTDSTELFENFTKVNGVRPFYGEIFFGNSAYERNVAVQVEDMARKNGVLKANFSFKRFVPIFKKFKVGSEGYVFLSDKHSNILIHPNNKLSVSRKKLCDLGITEINFLLPQDKPFVFELNDGKRYLINYNYLSNFGVVVWSIQAESEVDLLAASLRSGMLGILISMLLFSALISMWMSSWLTKPLHHLAVVMNNAGENGIQNLNENTGIHRSDEIGILANEFDVMRISLKNYIQKLDESNSVLEEKVRVRTAELEEMSRTDPLTGAPNRRDILEKIEQESIRSKRTGNLFCFIIGDIDKFKAFNDTYGHECGDDVLKIVSSEIKNCLRECDFYCRWGGEEFLMVLPETDLAQAAIAAERIRAKIIERKLSFQGNNLHISMTLGISQYSEKIGVDESIAISDQGLYHGKNSGRNCVVVMSASDEQRKENKLKTVLFADYNKNIDT